MIFAPLQPRSTRSRLASSIALATAACALLAVPLRAAQPQPEPPLQLERDTRPAVPPATPPSAQPAIQPPAPPLQPAAATAPTALAVKGDRLGANLAEFAEKYRREVHVPPHEPATAPAFDFGRVFDAKDALEQPSYYNRRQSGIVRARVKFDYEPGGVRNDTLGKIRAEIQYFFYALSLADWDTVAVRARERREWSERERAVATTVLLGQVEASFNQSYVGDMRAVLIEKYGPPKRTRDSEDKFDNAPGEVFRSEELTWVIGDDMISLLERAGRSDQSLVIFWRPSITERAETLKKARIKNAVDDL